MLPRRGPPASCLIRLDSTVQVITNYITTSQAAIDVRHVPTPYFDIPSIFPSTTLHVVDRVQASQMNGVRDICIHGAGLQNRVVQLYCCADTLVRSQFGSESVRNPRALGMGHKKPLFVVSGALDKGEEFNQIIEDFWGQTELHFGNKAACKDPTIDKLPGRGLKIIHKSDLDRFKGRYHCLDLTLNYDLVVGLQVQILKHDTHSGYVGKIVHVKEDICFVQFDWDGHSMMIKMPIASVAEFLEPGSEVLVTGMKDPRLNLKYGMVVDYDFKAQRYAVEFDFLKQPKMLPRTNLHARTGLLLLGDKDHVVMRKCPNTGVMTAYVFFPVDDGGVQKPCKTRQGRKTVARS